MTMEFTGTATVSHRERFLSENGQITTHVTSRRKPSLRANFSYPGLTRHESCESQSSNSTVPGMTDTSDSDLSFDDDGIYNTSAGELWDSFWRVNTAEPTCQHSYERKLSLLPAGPNESDLRFGPTRRRQLSVEAVSPTTIEVRELSTALAELALPPIKSAHHRTPVAYSVYPRPLANGSQKRSHPPRSSSLSFESPLPAQQQKQQRPCCASTKSSTGMHPIKPGYDNNRPIPISPARYRKATHSPQSLRPPIAKTAASVPVSPIYPAPPPPFQSLRPCTSGSNIEDCHTRARNNSNSKEPDAYHGTSPPLKALLPSALPNPAAPPTQVPPEQQFVSVFEMDSDSETDADERNSFARRIARGLHKKSASEKRSPAERTTAVTPGRRAASDADAFYKEARRARVRSSRSNSTPGRKRGGSLGRIFWLMSSR